MSQRDVQDDREVVRFRGTLGTCGSCGQRARCLRHPRRTAARQVAFYGAILSTRRRERVQRMKDKVVSAAGQARYGLRLATAEPPFANICKTLGLDRLTLRGRDKVNAQWMSFTALHNIGKLNRYGYADE